MTPEAKNAAAKALVAKIIPLLEETGDETVVGAALMELTVIWLVPFDKQQQDALAFQIGAIQRALPDYTRALKEAGK